MTGAELAGPSPLEDCVGVVRLPERGEVVDDAAEPGISLIVSGHLLQVDHSSTATDHHSLRNCLFSRVERARRNTYDPYLRPPKAMQNLQILWRDGITLLTTPSLDLRLARTQVPHLCARVHMVRRLLEQAILAVDKGIVRALLAHLQAALDVGVAAIANDGHARLARRVARRGDLVDERVDTLARGEGGGGEAVVDGREEVGICTLSCVFVEKG